MPPKRKSETLPTAYGQEMDPVVALAHHTNMIGSPEPKRQRLEEDGARQIWNEMFFELLHYRAEHGDMKVRAKEDAKYRRLYEWIVAQRKEFKAFQEDPNTSALLEEQIVVLDSLQFPWNTRGEDHWNLNFDSLKKFYKEHDHTMVSRSDQEHQKLSMWVVDQRRQMKLWKEGKQTTMTKERQKLLDDLDFTWQIRNKTNWDIRYLEMVEYKDKHGTTVVPQHFKENKALGKWVAKQREQYRFLKEGKHSFLTPDRLEKLNAIEFVWSLKGRAPKDEGMMSNEIVAAQVAAMAGLAPMQPIMPKMDSHHHQQQQPQMTHHQMNHQMNQPQFVQPNYQMHHQMNHHHQDLSDSMKEITDEAIHQMEKGNNHLV